MSASRYTATAVALHWLIAALVLGQIALGWWMIDIPKSPPGVRAYWFNVHKSIGITIGLLVLFRIYWRLRHGAPPLPAHVPPWQRLAAKTSHALLYVCMLTMPLTGYLGSNFTRYPIVFYGMRLPHWGWDNPAGKELMSQVHYATVLVFMVLIALHFAAAMKHLAARDGVFQRIWPKQREALASPLDASGTRR